MLQRGIKHTVDEDDKPIPFSTSKAAHWKAEYSRAPPDVRVWYTPHVVTASVMLFMIYFCILREENDLDDLIYRPLPETLKGIEKAYPGFDFYEKPSYITFHEEQKKKSEEK